MSFNKTNNNDIAQPIALALAEFPAVPIYLALSGGMDSLLMLHALASMPSYRERLHAIHVHHGLSKNADHWQQHCQNQCDALGVPLTVEKVAIDVQGKGVEAAARAARYQVFERCVPANAVVLLAHHQDDQAETLLLRLLRGAGLAGLGAMPAKRLLTRKDNETRWLLRPWLNLARASLANVAQQMQLDWIEDESNQDMRYQRNWLRREIFPLLNAHTSKDSSITHQSLATAAVVKSAARLQQDYQLLQRLLAPYRQQLHHSVAWPMTAKWALDLDALQHIESDLHHHLLRDWLQQNGLEMPAGERLLHWLEQCFSAAADKQPSCDIGTWRAQRYRRSIYLWQPRSLPNAQVLQDSLSWAGGRIVGLNSADWLRNSKDCGSFKKDQSFQIVSAEHASGTFLRPVTLTISGRPTKTLKHLWQEQGVPPWIRPYWPLIVSTHVNQHGGEIMNCVAVIGIGVDETYDSVSFGQWLSTDAFAL